MAGNEGKDGAEEKKRFHTLAETLVKLSKNKFEVAKELSKATDELDFAPEEDEDLRNTCLEQREELMRILKNMVKVEKSLKNFYKACAGTTFDGADIDQESDDMTEIKQAALEFVGDCGTLQSEVNLYKPTPKIGYWVEDEYEDEDGDEDDDDDEDEDEDEDSEN